MCPNTGKYGQIRQIQYLGCVFGHAKHGQVGCPWKGLAKCSALWSCFENMIANVFWISVAFESQSKARSVFLLDKVAHQVDKIVDEVYVSCEIQIYLAMSRLISHISDEFLLWYHARIIKYEKRDAFIRDFLPLWTAPSLELEEIFQRAGKKGKRMSPLRTWWQEASDRTFHLA